MDTEKVISDGMEVPEENPSSPEEMTTEAAAPEAPASFAEAPSTAEGTSFTETTATEGTTFAGTAATEGTTGTETFTTEGPNGEQARPRRESLPYETLPPGRDGIPGR